jgi:hypothetical protein
MILGSIDITDEDGRRLLLERAQKHVEFPVELIDIDGLDWGVASAETKAILFRSYYNRLPVVTFAGAYLDWIDPDGVHDFIPF